MQPLPEKRKYPKSVGVKIKAICGHNYTNRIDLTDLWYLNPEEFEKKRDSLISKTENALAKRECNNCLGKQEIEIIRKANNGIMDSLGLPRFSPIETGSYGQKAWAERVRSNHLQHLLFFSVSLVGAMTISEYIIMGKSCESMEYEEAIKKSLKKFRKITKHISEVGYLGYVFSSELSDNDFLALRRLLIVRHLVKENLLFFQEYRHTSWIMHEKNGKNPYNTRFKHISPNVYFALAIALMESLPSIEAYESLFESMSERARVETKEILDSLDDRMSPAEKMELVKVYLSLKGTEAEPPF
jgi:hypothetical protein